MHLLITGATGLIGSALVHRLEQEGHQITALTRDPRLAKDKLGSNHQYISSLNQLDNLDHFNAVINLAGEPIAEKRWSTKQKNRIEASRWNTTQSLVDLLKVSRHPPSVFISGSAVGYYGKQLDIPITEDVEPFQQDFSHRLCAVWENIAMSADSLQTRVCLLRTGIVLSDKGGALSKLLLPFKLGVGGKIGNGRHFMPWIHIDDMVAGILFLLHQDNCNGAYNLTAPYPVTNKEFTQKLGKRLARPTFFTTPTLVLKLLFGEMSELLTQSQQVLPEKLQKSGFHFQYPQLEAALDNLDI